MSSQVAREIQNNYRISNDASDAENLNALDGRKIYTVVSTNVGESVIRSDTEFPRVHNIVVMKRSGDWNPLTLKIINGNAGHGSTLEEAAISLHLDPQVEVMTNFGDASRKWIPAGSIHPIDISRRIPSSQDFEFSLNLATGSYHGEIHIVSKDKPELSREFDIRVE